MAKAGLSAKSIMMVLQPNRRETAPCVQSVFTDFGCVIRTRIGLHDGTGDSKCSNMGLILLELVGERRQHVKLAAALNKIEDVKAKLVSISF